MYLSRIQLTDKLVEHSQLGLLLKDRSYGMHRLLWDLFETGEKFIFREESSREQLGGSRNTPLYYVLSRAVPKSTSPILQVDTKRYAPSLTEGDHLAFRLRANPTISRREPGKKHSARHDVVMDTQYHWLRQACAERGLSAEGKKGELQRSLRQHTDFFGAEQVLKRLLEEAGDQAAVQWLSARGDSNGYQLNTCQATGYRWHALPEKSRSAGFSSMDYEGVLTVTDPERFTDALISGLGRSKAFGCGLMMIRRI